MLLRIVCICVAARCCGAPRQRSASAAERRAVRDGATVHRVSHAAHDAVRRRHLDRRRLAGDDDGQFRKRSLLAGRGQAGDPRSSKQAKACDRRRMLQVPYADGAQRSRFEGQREARSSRICRSASDDRMDRSARRGWCVLFVMPSDQQQKSSAHPRAWSAASSFDTSTGLSANARGIRAVQDRQRNETRIMRTSSPGYRPTEGEHIRQSELCATCHTLNTEALADVGEWIGALPEQMPSPGVAGE